MVHSTNSSKVSYWGGIFTMVVTLVAIFTLFTGNAAAQRQNNPGAVFDKLETKLDSVEGKIDALKGKVDVLDDKAVSMEGKIDALVADNTSEINALESKLAATEANLDAALRCVIGSPGFLNIGLTVFDCQTALEWEKKTDDNGIHDKDNVYSWSATGILFDGPAKTAFLDVLNDVAGGETNCFAGHCDWRLPKVNENSDFTAELETILDCSSFFAPCIDPIFGPVASVYWSATTAACCGQGPTRGSRPNVSVLLRT